MKRKKFNETESFERALKGVTKKPFYVLRLYVSGLTPRSRQAIDTTKKLCDEHLRDRYSLDIIDVFQNPAAAREGQVIAAPTLIKKLPLPLRKFVGDMTKTERIIAGLELRVEEADKKGKQPKPGT